MSNVFEAHVNTATTWVHEIGTHLSLDTDHDALALHALRVGLHAIRDRLPPHEVLDLAAQLPIVIRGFYLEGWRLEHAGKRIRDRAALLECVHKELGMQQRVESIDVLRAVIRVLEAHVSNGELADVIATLPKPLAALWLELSGKTLTSIPAAGHAVRRTGYAR